MELSRASDLADVLAPVAGPVLPSSDNKEELVGMLLIVELLDGVREADAAVAGVAAELDAAVDAVPPLDLLTPILDRPLFN